MSTIEEFEVGQTLELADGRVGVVQFIGTTQFADGQWIGVVLEDRSGKNDGAVQGQRYFRCEPGKGMFVRPTGVSAILQQPATKSTKRTSTNVPSATTKARVPARTSNAAGAVKRQSIVDPTEKRRSLINANLTPAGKAAQRPQALRPLSKSPTKQLTSKPSAGTSSLRSSLPPTTTKPSNPGTSRASISGRLSSTNQNIKPSTGGAGSNGVARTSSLSNRKPANRLSTLQHGPRSGSVSSASQSARSDQMSPTGSQDQERLVSPNDDENRTIQDPAKAGTFAKHNDSLPEEPNTRRHASPEQTSRAPLASSAVSRENEDLKTKLRLLDKKCGEYREKLKVLEKVQEERDKFEGIIQKLQKKYQPQQQEIASLKKQIKELESRTEASETNQMDIDTAVELATLDREMAEETAEACKQELEILRQEHEEIRLEVEILREENAELAKEMSPEERTSQGWLQLERSNERLREALMRLRDMAQETEAEFKHQVQELEADVKDLSPFKEEWEELKAKQDQNESLVEDLRAQLETASGAEDMIEELTESNMALKEELEELKNAVEDLENLKELNDELELNHVENEKQMQEEIDFQEALFLEQQRLSNQKDETIEELEYTTSRFRELVSNLQGDLEEMRASQQITELEANELSSKSRAMMDLNLRLQASASKSQIKAIEIEMGKLDSQEAHDHLNIVQYFLPPSYLSHKDSVEAFLRVKRIGFKSGILQGIVKDRATAVATPGHEDDAFAACDAFDKLSWISSMCQRLSNFVQHSPLDSFQKFAAAMLDLEPVERAFNGWLENVKRDEFKDRQCAADLGRSIALMTHLSEAHIIEGLEEYAEDVLMRALVMQGQLESSVMIVAQIKAITQVKLILPTDADEEDEAEAESFLEKADALVAQLRSAKVVGGKVVQQVSDLKSRSLTLDPSTSDQIDQFQLPLLEYFAACQSASSGFLSVVNEEGRADSLTYGEVIRALNPSDTIPFSTLTIKLRNVLDQVQAWQNLTSTLSQTLEFTDPSRLPPWKVLSDQLRADVSATVAQERELQRLKDEVSERNTTIAMKEKTLEELNVNVEVLTKRVSEFQGRREQLRDLESQIERHLRREKEGAAKLAQAQEALRRLEAERGSWNQRVAAVDGSTNSEHPGSGSPFTTVDVPTSGEHTGPTAAWEAARLKEEIQTLQGTIRHLRQSAYRSTFSNHHCSFLSSQLYPLPEQPLDEPQKLGYEAKDALKALIELTGSRSSVVPELSLRDKEERLQWRPAKDSIRWQVQRQQEDWEAWCDWRDDLAKSQSAAKARLKHSSLGGSHGSQVHKESPLARLGVSFPGKDWDGRSQVVRIVRPEEWNEIEREFGVA